MVLRVLLRLVWSQKSGSAWFSLLWKYLRAFRKWESISLGLSGSVEIQGHAVAKASTGVARALLSLLYSQGLSLLPSLSINQVILPYLSLWLTPMTHAYRELLFALHKAGNGVPDFNTDGEIERRRKNRLMMMQRINQLMINIIPRNTKDQEKK